MDPHNLQRPTQDFIQIPRSMLNKRMGAYWDQLKAAIQANIGIQVFKKDAVLYAPKEPLKLIGFGSSSWLSTYLNKFPKEFEEQGMNVTFTKAIPEKVLKDEESLHLLIQIDSPSDTEERDTVPPMVERYNKVAGTPGSTPSTGAKSTEYIKTQMISGQTIYDGRHPQNSPDTNIARPIQIYHPIFDFLLQLISSPTTRILQNDVNMVLKLMKYQAYIGIYESSRNRIIRDLLGKILNLPIEEMVNEDGTSPDGVYMLKLLSEGGRTVTHAPLLVIELKRELGDGGSDPTIQAGLSMRRAWIQPKSAEMRNKCPCPTLMLTGAGPWLSIVGGVLADEVIVQRITDFKWSTCSNTEENARVFQVTRTLVALREALRALKEYYMELHSSYVSAEIPTMPNRFWPSPTSFTDADGKEVKFHYVDVLQQQDPTCVVFRAKIVEDPTSEIVVKFVSQYGREGHEFLAQHGHAPQLRYAAPLSVETKEAAFLRELAPDWLFIGPLQMIVMDYVPQCKRVPSDAREQIEAVLMLLHGHGFVFGDLRRCNVLFNAEGKVQFIDFDWAGRYDLTGDIDRTNIPVERLTVIEQGIAEQKRKLQGEVRAQRYAYYPLNLSTSIEWGKARDLEPILPGHDWFMLRAFFDV